MAIDSGTKGVIQLLLCYCKPEAVAVMMYFLEYPTPTLRMGCHVMSCHVWQHIALMIDDAPMLVKYTTMAYHVIISHEITWH